MDIEEESTWARLLAYVTGLVNQELLLWNTCAVAYRTPSMNCEVECPSLAMKGAVGSACLGNWLSVPQGQDLLRVISPEGLRGERDAAMLSLLLACGLRRSELVRLPCERIQRREDHWAIVDLVGKASHSRIGKLVLCWP
jgi:site-specific recombinase XerD